MELNQPSRDDTADPLLKWAGEWGWDWVVVDTHPGATEVFNGALSIAHVVVTPVPLRSSDLDGTEHMVRERADYPVVLIPNFVPPAEPAAEVCRLGRIVDGTPVRWPADPGRSRGRHPEEADGHHLRRPARQGAASRRRRALRQLAAFVQAYGA